MFCCIHSDLPVYCHITMSCKWWCVVRLVFGLLHQSLLDCSPERKNLDKKKTGGNLPIFLSKILTLPCYRFLVVRICCLFFSFVDKCEYHFLVCWLDRTSILKVSPFTVGKCDGFLMRKYLANWYMIKNNRAKTMNWYGRLTKCYQ